MNRGPHARLLAFTVVVAGAVVPATQVRATSAITTLNPTWTFSTGTTSARSPYWGAQPYAGAAVGDLLGDGTQDIVVGFPNGQLYAFNALTHAVLPGWPKQFGGAIDTTPTLADLYGDGRREVIATSQDGHIYAYEGNGNAVAGWPQSAWYGPAVARDFSSYFIGGAAVGDLFGDGRQEVVAAGADHYLYAWDAHGTLLSGFPVNLWDTSVATPALVDLDNNGRLWIIAGGDSVPNRGRTGAWYAIPPSGCAHPNDSLAGCDHAGWPRYQDEVPWSSPAAGDLQANGAQLVVTGTGHNYAQTGCPSCGRYLQVVSPLGGTMPGWPQYTGGQMFGSPAIGDLGHGGLDVVDQSESPALTAYDWRYQGALQWSAANTGANSDGTPATLTDLGSPAIAPVNGAANGVWTPGNGRIFGWGSNGALTAEVPIAGVSFATPTVSDLGDGSLSLAETFYNGNTSSPTYSMVVVRLPGTAANGIPANAWPTFHGNNQHSGGIVPVTTMSAGTTISGSEDNTISWNAAAGATGYHLWVNTPSLGWALYTTTNGLGATSVKFTGYPNTTYQFFVEAFNRLGSADQRKVAEHTLQISPGAVNHGPVAGGHGLYTMDAYGQVGSGNSPLAYPAGPLWPNWKIARAISMAPKTNPASGLVLDGFGGLHPVGTNPLAVPTNGGYWPNWDITRDIKITDTTGSQYGGYVLDGFGGVHPFGAAPAVDISGYWPNWAIAFKMTVTPGMPVGHTSGYVMDGFGGLHPFGTKGDMPAVPTGGPYWPNWTIARDVTSCRDGGGYVLDGFGGIHPFGGKPQPQWAGYWPNWDIARAITLDPTDTTCSRGWMVDGFGGIHPWGSWTGGLAAGQTDFPHYLPNQDAFRSISAS